MRSRQPGIDLLRCLGLLFVNGVHSFLYNGFYFEPQTGALMWAGNSLLWLFYTCNGLFMALTGYLKCEKPLSKSYYRSLLPILVGYLLTCLVAFPIRHYVIGEKLTLFQWVEKFVTFGNYAWYIEMYIGLLLISPIINLALSQLKTQKQLLWAAGTMLILSALPSITPLNLIPDYWTSLYPITYYCIGAVIRKLQPNWNRPACLGLAAVTALWTGFATLISTDGKFSDGFGQGYGGFWITAIILLLFIGLYRINPGEKVSKLLGWLSGGVFEGYLLSRLLDVWIYNTVPQWHTPAMYPVILVCITVPVFIVSILAGKLLHELALRICRPAARSRKGKFAAK